MPIRFRCSYCNRLLGIATRKAGMETTCPHCGYTITVPVPQQEQNDARTERLNLDDVDELLGNTKTEASPKSAVAEAPAAPSDPPAVEKPRTETPKPPPTYAKPAPAPVASPPPAPPPVQKPRSAPPPVPKPPRAPGEDPPLFEADVDELLGEPVKLEEPRDKPAPVTGMDAMSLGDPAHQIVISAQKATLLMILVVVLMALSFAAGMLVKG